MMRTIFVLILCLPFIHSNSLQQCCEDPSQHFHLGQCEERRNNPPLSSFFLEEYLHANPYLEKAEENGGQEGRIELNPPGNLILKCLTGSNSNVISVSSHPDMNTSLESNSTQQQHDFWFYRNVLKFKSEIFDPDQYCVNEIGQGLDSIELLICTGQNSVEDSTDKSVSVGHGCVENCIPKCCDVDEVLDFSLYPDLGNAKCKPSLTGRWWMPTVHSDLSSNQEEDRVDSNLSVVVNHPRNWCKGAQIHSLKKRVPKIPRRDVILPDGKAWMKVDRYKWIPLSLGTYCFDGGQSFGDPTSVYKGLSEETILVDCGEYSFDICRIEVKDEEEGVLPIPYIIGVASVFLLMTVLIYILLWEKQNVHGWTSLSYFASMFIMYLFTCLQSFDYFLFSQQAGYHTSYGCLFIAIGSHFAWLTTFCWMSCVNFDLWWTFRTLLPTSSRSKGLCRYLCYTLFSLGIPTCIVGVAITMDVLYKDDWDSAVIVPDYGRVKCFMDKRYAIFPYLYGPIAFLLSCNLVFFSVTVYDMYRIQQSTKFASMSSSKNTKQKQSVVLFAKLFLLMGIPWGFEVIEWAAKEPCGKTTWYWALFDYINILQAVAIFLTFVCKPDTISSLESKYPLFKRFVSCMTISPARSLELRNKYPRLAFVIKKLTRKKKTNSHATSKTHSTTLNSSTKHSIQVSHSSNSNNSTAVGTKKKISIPMHEIRNRGEELTD